jgi:hypothetical protein
MSTISQLIRNVQAINVSDVIQESIDDTKQALVRLQKLQMLFGERSDGKKIGKYRSIPYAVRKQAQNPLAGFKQVDLRLHGDFHGGLFADVRDDKVVFDSLDSKTEILVEKYGEKIFGLNKKNAVEYSQNHLAPVAVNNFKKQILK